ncbi:MAG: hypothetical protein MZV64_64665 [Ignavibacteriales bacterium]|nr:hypothetical protein [Ignavibacteriales bacterium]
MYGETVFSNARRTRFTGSGRCCYHSWVKRAVVWTKAGRMECSKHLLTFKLAIDSEINIRILSGINEGDEIAATGGFLG